MHATSIRGLCGPGEGSLVSRDQGSWSFLTVHCIAACCLARCLVHDLDLEVARMVAQFRLVEAGSLVASALVSVGSVLSICLDGPPTRSLAPTHTRLGNGFAIPS